MEIYALLEYLGMKKAKKVFTICERSKWELKKMYNIDSIIVYPGFNKQDYKDINFVDVIGKYQLPKNKKVIFSANRLTPRKRLDKIIYAFSKMTKKRNDIILVLGGKGEQYFELQNIIKKLNLQKLFIYLGFCQKMI